MRTKTATKWDNLLVLNCISVATEKLLRNSDLGLVRPSRRTSVSSISSVLPIDDMMEMFSNKNIGVEKDVPEIAQQVEVVNVEEEEGYDTVF